MVKGQAKDRSLNFGANLGLSLGSRGEQVKFNDPNEWPRHIALIRDHRYWEYLYYWKIEIWHLTRDNI